MLRTRIVLPDGTQLSSGEGTRNAIQSITVTQCVNAQQELTLGSACANMVELELLTPGGGLSVAAGDELVVYRVAEDGTAYKVGLFTAEKPERTSANTMRITAYDRVSWLDKDLTQWLAGLEGFPYALYDFAVMVCNACGVTLANGQIPNGGYPVQRFSADGITGRQLIRWVGEIAGRFCRATADGQLEFAWYTPADLTVSASTVSVSVACREDTLFITDNTAQLSSLAGDLTVTSAYLQLRDDEAGNVTLSAEDVPQQLYFFQGGLSYEDYAVAPIEKVQLRQSEEDIGTVYPDIAGAVNTYSITGNYLLTASTAEDLKPVAQTLYEHLAGVTYTPCKVTLPAGMQLQAGNTVQITDRNGKTITAYVMTKTQSGQKDTLECTGSARRDSSTVVNNQSFRALTGKVLNLRTDVEGLKLENADTKGSIAALELDLEGVRSQVAVQQTSAEGMRQQLTQLEQTAQSVDIAVKNILDNGVSKVTTQTGYSFSDAGLIISKSDSEMENRMDNTGMYVSRSGETMLQANKDGVIATDVKVRNYLRIGEHARFEDYTDGADSRRTACFWLGEE